MLLNSQITWSDDESIGNDDDDSDDEGSDMLGLPLNLIRHKVGQKVCMLPLQYDNDSDDNNLMMMTVMVMMTLMMWQNQ